MSENEKNAVGCAGWASRLLTAVGGVVSCLVCASQFLNQPLLLPVAFVAGWLIFWTSKSDERRWLGWFMFGFTAALLAGFIVFLAAAPYIKE